MPEESEESEKAGKPKLSKDNQLKQSSGTSRSSLSGRSSENQPRGLPKSQPSVTKKPSNEGETGSLKTNKSSVSSKSGTLEKMLTFMFPKLTKQREPEASPRKSLPEKLSSTSKKSPDYMKEKMANKAQMLLAKKASEMKLKDTALLNQLDDRLDRLKSLKVEVEHKREQEGEAKQETDFQPPIPYVENTKETNDGLDIVKRQSIDIIKKKVLNQGRLAQPPMIEKESYRIADKQLLDTDEDVFSVIDSKDIQKKKEEKPPKERTDAERTRKAKVKRRHRHRRRRHAHSKDSKLVNLLTKRRILQKVLEENLLIKKIKENCELRSGHIKTDIRLGCKNHSLVLEPVVNSDLLFDNECKTELEKLIETSRRSIGKRSALNDASLIIKSIEEDSRVLKDLNKEIESELNNLNKIKLEKRSKVVRNKSTSPRLTADKGKHKRSDAKKPKEGSKSSEGKFKRSSKSSDGKETRKVVAKGSNETRSKEVTKSSEDKKKFRKEGTIDAKDVKAKQADTVESANKADLTKEAKDEQQIKDVSALNLKNHLNYPYDPIICEGYKNETFSSRMDVEIERELAKKDVKNCLEAGPAEQLESNADEGEPGKDNVEVDVDEASLGRDNTMDDAKRMEVMNSEIKLREILRKEIRAKQDRDYRPMKDRRTEDRKGKAEKTKVEKKTESSSSDDQTADRAADKRDANETEPFKKE